MKVSTAFDLARQIAEQSDFTRTHVGCLITYKGIPIASGFNSNKTHPMQKDYNKYRGSKGNDNFVPKLHAEISALLKIKDISDLDPKKIRLHVYRIRKDQKYGMARPCPSCMKAIRDAGIRKIYYTTNNGYAEEILY